MFWLRALKFLVIEGGFLIAGKLTLFLCRLVRAGAGSSLPGLVALKQSCARVPVIKVDADETQMGQHEDPEDDPVDPQGTGGDGTEPEAVPGSHGVHGCTSSVDAKS